MKFTIGNATIDTASMKAFQTGNADERTIYMDPNCRLFVVASGGGSDGAAARLRLALTPEVRSLADRYGIADLASVLRVLHN